MIVAELPFKATRQPVLVVSGASGASIVGSWLVRGWWWLQQERRRQIIFRGKMDVVRSSVISNKLVVITQCRRSRYRVARAGIDLRTAAPRRSSRARRSRLSVLRPKQ